MKKTFEVILRARCLIQEERYTTRRAWELEAELALVEAQVVADWIEVREELKGVRKMIESELDWKISLNLLHKTALLIL
jgi:hypothetical protein